MSNPGRISVRCILGSGYRRDSINLSGDLEVRLAFKVVPEDVPLLQTLHQLKGKVFYLTLIAEDETR